MKFLSILKNLSSHIKYYDKISPLPYSKKTYYNPFLPKKCVTMIWIDDNKKRN